MTKLLESCSTCGVCEFWKWIWRGMGLCMNINSDHHKHVIMKEHPGCDVIKSKNKKKT